MTDAAATRIARAFNGAFGASHRTLLFGGGAEPLYVPADAQQPARIVFTRDYAASALHEAAHWCLAGAARRRLPDYGYAYVPGPRTAPQREAFFAAECDVQALEALFADVCAVRFVVSADDFAAPHEELAAFERRVLARLADRRRTGLAGRAAVFRNALVEAFRDG